ncbi:hypothetical protein ZWY2020_005304 [Hordeum vulgare]|nr:hypothetical protein ZWY2020_005304 [Hordeum vulgare]
MDISSWFTSAKSEVPSSWGHAEDCCSWERITCDNSTRRILRLDLSSIYHSIPIHNSDGSTSTQVMEVACWNLNLTIFSSFRELQLLDFSGNCACLQDFDGLQGLSKLKYLNLRDNSFIGSIPESVSKLVSLEVINLNKNNMSGALQNTGLKNLQNLRELHMGSNQLSGHRADARHGQTHHAGSPSRWTQACRTPTRQAHQASAGGHGAQGNQALHPASNPAKLHGHHAHNSAPTYARTTQPPSELLPRAEAFATEPLLRRRAHFRIAPLQLAPPGRDCCALPGSPTKAATLDPRLTDGWTLGAEAERQRLSAVTGVLDRMSERYIYRERGKCVHNAH